MSSYKSSATISRLSLYSKKQTSKENSERQSSKLEEKSQFYWNQVNQVTKPKTSSRKFDFHDIYLEQMHDPIVEKQNMADEQSSRREDVEEIEEIEENVRDGFTRKEVEDQETIESPKNTKINENDEQMIAEDEKEKIDESNEILSNSTAQCLEFVNLRMKDVNSTAKHFKTQKKQLQFHIFVSLFRIVNSERYFSFSFTRVNQQLSQKQLEEEECQVNEESIIQYLKNWVEWAIIKLQLTNKYCFDSRRKQLSERRSDEIVNYFLEKKDYEMAEFYSCLEDKLYRSNQLSYNFLQKLDIFTGSLLNESIQSMEYNHWVIDLALGLWYFTETSPVQVIKQVILKYSEVNNHMEQQFVLLQILYKNISEEHAFIHKKVIYPPKSVPKQKNENRVYQANSHDTLIKLIKTLKIVSQQKYLQDDVIKNFQKQLLLRIAIQTKKFNIFMEIFLSIDLEYQFSKKLMQSFLQNNLVLQQLPESSKNEFLKEQEVVFQQQNKSKQYKYFSNYLEYKAMKQLSGRRQYEEVLKYGLTINYQNLTDYKQLFEKSCRLLLETLQQMSVVCSYKEVNCHKIYKLLIQYQGHVMFDGMEELVKLNIRGLKVFLHIKLNYVSLMDNQNLNTLYHWIYQQQYIASQLTNKAIHHSICTSFDQHQRSELQLNQHHLRFIRQALQMNFRKYKEEKIHLRKIVDMISDPDKKLIFEALRDYQKQILNDLDEISEKTTEKLLKLKENQRIREGNLLKLLRVMDYNKNLVDEVLMMMFI